MNRRLPPLPMSALLDKVNGYKVYIVCATSLLYIWCSYLLGLFTAQGDLATTSFAPAQTMDLHGAIIATLGVLGAAGFRHALQKIEYFLAVPDAIPPAPTPAIPSAPQA